MSPSSDYKKFSKVLSNAKHIIVVAGAGLSAASGIPTFRGAGGLWRQYNAMSLATPQAFKRDPSLVWQFYHYRREAALKAKPNAAHRALAEFSLSSIRSRHAPRLDIHPHHSECRRPEYRCSRRSRRRTTPHTRNARASIRRIEELVDKHAMEPDIPQTELPRCAKCNALARPGVVWFEEMPLCLDVINKLVYQADLCLVVGTSSTVYPAAGYAEAVSQNGGQVAVFNLDRSDGDEDVDFLFLGSCDETLPKALGLSDG
ncbi:DHS-like NAD/FAD-binding domain-containing protein [Armillaria mellea]|nr:DHS-like NAD/FAD-binding domain-containing protein [Armillaria mellea]